MKHLYDLKPGDFFNFAGEQFVVLEQRKGSTFVLLAYNKGLCSFNERDDIKIKNPNDYTRSVLKERIDEWAKALPRTAVEAFAILPFEVDLSCTDRSESYGDITVKAAPLTIWQQGQFKKLIPQSGNNWDDGYWLVTPRDFRWLDSQDTDNARSVWYVSHDGVQYNGYASYELGIRPALLLSSNLPINAPVKVKVVKK